MGFWGVSDYLHICYIFSHFLKNHSTQLVLYCNPEKYFNEKKCGFFSRKFDFWSLLNLWLPWFEITPSNSWLVNCNNQNKISSDTVNQSNSCYISHDDDYTRWPSVPVKTNPVNSFLTVYEIGPDPPLQIIDLRNSEPTPSL